MASFSPRMNILDSLCEGLLYRTNLSGKEREQWAYEVLEQVGLNDKIVALRNCNIPLSAISIQNWNSY